MEQNIIYLYLKDGTVKPINRDDYKPGNDPDLFMWSNQSREENTNWEYNDGAWAYVGPMSEPIKVCGSCGSRNCIC